MKDTGNLRKSPKLIKIHQNSPKTAPRGTKNRPFHMGSFFNAGCSSAPNFLRRLLAPPAAGLVCAAPIGMGIPTEEGARAGGAVSMDTGD